MKTQGSSFDRDWTPDQPVAPPPHRRLRGYSFDPSLATQLETAIFAAVTFHVPWEPLERGPIGEYLEIVDYDPASGCFYMPVNLDDPNILAQDGLAPSEGSPHFHQQMVYAVAMTTVKNFERALGRWAFWGARELNEQEKSLPDLEKYKLEYVQRLRIYPHALRQANAYYSPVKKALLFGYFPAAREAGGMVFTCLSHDIVAHETTHALLDGMHSRFLEPSHPDTRAFHEAFADIVALFQRFSISEVLGNQIAKTRGDIAGTASLLGALAQQFGQATGHYGALREFIGRFDEKTGAWEPRPPDPNEYRTVLEEHDRGAILVAAVFDAFLAIYRLRVSDLQRIATGGTGVLPQGELHPDLVNRFAQEAAKTAKHILNICVRALDYCPPVDITFGDYLRALITADHDVVPDDQMGYRVAFIEAFRRRGILPEDVRVISEDSLLWDTGAAIFELDNRRGSHLPLEECFASIAGFLQQNMQSVTRSTTRREHYVATQELSRDLHKYLREEFHEVRAEALHELTGLLIRRSGILRFIQQMIQRPDAGDGEDQPTVSDVYRFQVHSLRPAQRVGPDGTIRSHIVITLLQKRIAPLDPEEPFLDARGKPSGTNEFVFRGGCTLILDLDTLKLRYVIKKAIYDESRLERQRRYLLGEWGMPDRAAYLSGRFDDEDEPFALLHTNL